MTKKEWKILYREQIKLQTCYCYLCGKPIKKLNELSLDHQIPLSRGGRNDSSNWRASHEKCNSDKGALTYEEYIVYLYLLKKKHGMIK